MADVSVDELINIIGRLYVENYGAGKDIAALRLKNSALEAIKGPGVLEFIEENPQPEVINQLEQQSQKVSQFPPSDNPADPS